MEGGGTGWKRKEEQLQTMKEDEKHASTKGPHTKTCSGQYSRTCTLVAVRGLGGFSRVCEGTPFDTCTASACKGDGRLREGGGRAHASRERMQYYGRA